MTSATRCAASRMSTPSCDALTGAADRVGDVVAIVGRRHQTALRPRDSTSARARSTGSGGSSSRSTASDSRANSRRLNAIGNAAGPLHHGRAVSRRGPQHQVGLQHHRRAQLTGDEPLGRRRAGPTEPARPVNQDACPSPRPPAHPRWRREPEAALPPSRPIISAG